MKVIPFLISTIVCAVCFILSVLFFFKAGSNRSMKEALLKQQASNQELQQKVKVQDEKAQEQAKTYQVSLGIAQLRQNDLQRMQQVIETGASVAQKLGPQILTNIGYLAAKNNNQELKKVLAKQKWEKFIPSPDQLKEIEAQIAKQQAGQPAGTPAPAPRPSAPTPGPR